MSLNCWHQGRIDFAFIGVGSYSDYFWFILHKSAIRIFGVFIHSLSILPLGDSELLPSFTEMLPPVVIGGISAPDPLLLRECC